MTYLEESALLERDYCNSLVGAIEALRASTLRLPVVGGARVSTSFFLFLFGDICYPITENYLCLGLT